jgi:hypothetical protein
VRRVSFYRPPKRVFGRRLEPSLAPDKTKLVAANFATQLHSMSAGSGIDPF